MRSDNMARLTAASNRNATKGGTTSGTGTFAKRGLSVGHSTALNTYGFRENKKNYKDLVGVSEFSEMSSIS